LVRAVAGNHYPAGNVAFSALTAGTVNTAVTGTQPAILKDKAGFLRPKLKLSGTKKPLISGYLGSSSSSGSFFPFLIISTGGEGVRIVTAAVFLASFLGFFDSLCRKSRFPIMTPIAENRAKSVT